MLLPLVFSLKYICLRTSLFIFSCDTFFWCLCFCVVLFSPENIGMVLSLFLCAPLICMFPCSCSSWVCHFIVTHIDIHGAKRNTNTDAKKVVQGKIKTDAVRQMYFNVNDKNGIRFEYFNLRTNTVEQF
jgi:hypothetical protein